MGILFLGVPCLSSGLALAEQSDIPPGTVITTRNWQQYKDFMTDGMQALFSGKYFWKVPPEGQLVVGPTIPMPLPKLYLQDTERYSRQVRLVRLSSGGYTLDNYVAGLPFPNPSGPQKAMQIVYNVYYTYVPYRAYTGASLGYAEDQNGNLSESSIVYSNASISI